MHAGVEVGQRNGALAAHAVQRELRPQYPQRGDGVIRRGSRRQVPGDGPPIAKGRCAHAPTGLGQGQRALLEQRGSRSLRVRDHRAEVQQSILAQPDVVQTPDAGHIDQDGRGARTVL